MDNSRKREPNRRSVIFGLGGLAAGAAASAVSWNVAAANHSNEIATPSTFGASNKSVNPVGKHQPGVRRPETPQQHALLMVLDIPDTKLGWLSALGETLIDVVEGVHPNGRRIMPDGVGDLSVTVGLGPRLISAVDSTLPGAVDLPAFGGDEKIPGDRRGGDVMLAAYSSNPTTLRPVLDLLVESIPAAKSRWEQRGFRGPGTGTVARNPLGFLDGIIVPRSDSDFDTNVWISDGPLAGGTICVVRRLRLDIVAFHKQSQPDQEAVFGRHADDGAPLSGGTTRDQVDLRAKTPEGQYAVPAHAHARAAHPSFTGSELMHRRSYTFDDGAIGERTDSGLLFMSYQKSLRTFVATQQRLDEVDALAQFVEPSGSATFLILPGFTRSVPLGSSITTSRP